MKGKILATTIILMLVFAGHAYADVVIRSNDTKGEEPEPPDETINDNATEAEPWLIAPSPNEEAKDSDIVVSVDEQSEEEAMPRNATTDERETSNGKGEAPEDDATIGVDDWLISPQGEVDDAISGGNSSVYLFAVPLVCAASVASIIGVRRRRH